MRGFIVYPDYEIINGEAYVHLYGRLENGDTFLTINHIRPYFFIPEEFEENARDVADRDFDLESTDLEYMDGTPVSKVVLWNPKNVPDLREQFHDADIPTYEADVRFVYRFLIDQDIKGSMDIEGDWAPGEEHGVAVDRVYEEPELEPVEWKPELATASIDIETDDDQLLSIAVYTEQQSICLVHGEGRYDNAETYEEEGELLERFKEVLHTLDPDIITGWNVIDFDLDFLEDRFREHDIDFDLGRTDETTRLRRYDDYYRNSSADCPGRQVLDGMHLMRISFIRLEDEKLDTAAHEFLGEEKLIEGESKHEDILDAYENDTQRFINYNIRDARLALDVIDEAGVLDLTVERSLISGMQLDRVQGSVASLDNLYLRRLRNRGRVAPTNDYRNRDRRITGGHVMESRPGIYDYVIVCDFSSLYPSIMCTFNIDPLTYVAEGQGCDDCIEAPNGAQYERGQGIVPELLTELWEERDEAKAEDDELRSNAIKVLMNSVFGVLANPNCRFYNFEMANSITHFGQELIKLTAEQIDEQGYEVIYGDTDSIFVDVKVQEYEEAVSIGEEIEDYVNEFFTEHVEDEYGVNSYIDLEFEKTYKRFLMPRTRSGSKSGAKKRYAGLIEKDDGATEHEYVGLEIVRRDWTDLAKEFQEGLIEKVFAEEDVRSYVQDFVERVKEGEMDDKLVYKKGMTKAPDEYKKTTPQHVKAAKKMDEIDSHIISYVITVDGPEPIGNVEHSIDYEHYLEKQIKPIANQILDFYDTNFDDVLMGTHQASLDGF